MQQTAEKMVNVHTAATRQEATADGLQSVLTGQEKGAEVGDVTDTSASKGR